MVQFIYIYIHVCVGVGLCVWVYTHWAAGGLAVRKVVGLNPSPVVCVHVTKGQFTLKYTFVCVRDMEKTEEDQQLEGATADAKLLHKDCTLNQATEQKICDKIAKVCV